MNLKFLKTKKTFAKTLLVSYVSIALICTVVLGMITLRYESFVRQENEKLNQYLFTAVSQSVNETLSDIRSLKVKIFESNAFHWIEDNQSNHRFWTAETSLEGVNLLKEYDESERIEISFVYLKLADEVVSRHGIINSEMFYTMYFSESGISYEDWLSILNENIVESYINLSYRSEFGMKEGIALVSPLLGEDAVSVIVADRNHFLYHGQQEKFDDVFNVYIYGSSDRLMISENNTGEKEIPYTRDDLDRMLKEDKTAIFNVSSPGPSREWTVATVMPEKVFAKKIVFMRAMAALFAGVFLVVLALLIRFFIRRNTEHIKRMKSILNAETTANEYQELYHSVEQIMSENLSLQRDSDKKDEQLWRIFLSRVVKGDGGAFGEGNYEEKFSSPYFALLTFHLEDIGTLFPDAPDMPLSERKQYLQLIIGNIFEEKFSESSAIGYVTSVDGLPVCLLNLSENNDGALQQVKAVADECTAFINKHFGLELTYVLSDIYDEIQSVSQGYIRTLETLEYKRHFGVQDSMLCREVSFDFSEEYLFTFEREAQLIRAIRNGQCDEAHHMIDQIFRFLENKRTFSSEYIRCIVRDMMCAIMKATGSNIQQELQFSQFVMTKPLSEMHQLLQKHLSDLCMGSSGRGSDADKANGELVQKVSQYVIDNYCDSSLNVASIGAHFDMAPYYLSRIFKESMGISLVDFLNSYRIKEAKKLMENSELPGKVIAEKVGFNHVRTFYRLFKKHIDE